MMDEAVITAMVANAQPVPKMEDAPQKQSKLLAVVDESEQDDSATEHEEKKMDHSPMSSLAEEVPAQEQAPAPSRPAEVAESMRSKRKYDATMSAISKLTDHDDIEDAVTVTKSVVSYSTRHHGDEASRASRSETKRISDDSSQIVSRSRSSHRTPDKGYVMISRTLLILLSIFATLGFVFGTASFAIALVALIDDGSDTASSRSAADTVDPNEAAIATDQSLLDQIFDRGILNCGLAALQPGFFFENGVDAATGEPTYVGCDVDICSALAAAIIGDPTAFRTHKFEYNERWTKLNSTEVDVVFRSTYTMVRDMYIDEIQKGVEFSTPYFYDGMGYGGLEEFVGCAESGLVNGTCADLRICVFQGTTFQEEVENRFPTENIVVIAGEFLAYYPSNCNVLAAEQIQISELTMRQKGYEGEYFAGTEVFSRDPISLVTREGDARWTDFVEYVLQSLVYAEKNGISRITAANMPTTSLFGPRYEAMFQNAISARGNFGEIYNSNLESFLPRSGMNVLNTEGAPMLWSYPFGDLKATGPPLAEISPMIKKIKERGFLKCGHAVILGFSAYNPEKMDYAGFDVDICRALSVAIFDGVDRSFLEQTDYIHRWDTLNSGSVDVLSLTSTWSIERDVMEPTTMKGYSFTDPHGYFWHSFGGLPEFVECAENLDVVSPACQNLRICVSSSTSLYDSALELIGNDFYLVGRNSFPEMIRGLADGSCNVMYNTNVEIQEHLVRLYGYGTEAPYVVGKRQFVVEPATFVTREEDPVWSGFVRWVVMALIYAEENGVTKETANLMPRPTLFGPFGSNVFYHAVNAVGNYGDVYDRNFGRLLVRIRQNKLNTKNQPRIDAIALT